MSLPALFNPSNDMALAVNVRQYFPPRHIQQMEDDLADLSRFWDEGPWGWSLATKQRYLRMGIDENELPSDEGLAEIRKLSSRQFGVAYYQQLTGALRTNRLLPCQARFCTSLDELELSIFNFQSSIIKAPWSSSGRGNMVVEEPIKNFDRLLKHRIERIIREQGGIAVEPFYANKTLDFAMEFNITDQGAQFIGYSVFSTDETGHYIGNYVESQASLLQRIDLPDDLMQSLIDYHLRELSRLAYRGPVGIDMMKLKDGCIHPCVEINFRRTMGLLAILLYNKGIVNDQLLAGRPNQGFSVAIKQGCLCIHASKQ